MESKILSWNARGLNKGGKRLRVKNLLFFFFFFWISEGQESS
jgi:hypothetical protein